jgi:hypothetical protein
MKGVRGMATLTRRLNGTFEVSAEKFTQFEKALKDTSKLEEVLKRSASHKSDHEMKGTSK